MSLLYVQLTRRTFFEADLIDQQKEVEERKLQLVEEREKEREKEKEGGKKAGSGGGVPIKSPVVQRAPNKKLKGVACSQLHVPTPTSTLLSLSLQLAVPPPFPPLARLPLTAVALSPPSLPSLPPPHTHRCTHQAHHVKHSVSIHVLSKETVVDRNGIQMEPTRFLGQCSIN